MSYALPLLGFGGSVSPLRRTESGWLRALLACAMLFSGPLRSAASPPSPKLRVLFIGNSYTFVNDLPEMLRAMGAAAGVTVSVESVTQGSATLQMLWGTTAPARIAEGRWTHVVLQEQSGNPCANPEVFLTYAAKFAAAIVAAHAKPVFYETWPRRAGDALYTQSWTGGNPTGMQACLHKSYSEAARASGGILAPVGTAWMHVLDQKPAFPIYQEDGSHPTMAGTFLAAAVLLSSMVPATHLPTTFTPEDLSDADRDWLARVATSVKR